MKLRAPACLIVAASLALALSPSHAALVVNQDLGTVGLGTLNLTGNTADGANNADIYAGLVVANANWGNEFVYQFTVTSTLTLTIQSNSLSGDPDFFLLDSLATGPAGAKIEALGGLESAFLDAGPPESASLGILTAGTYYLSVDSFIGFDGGLNPGDATFDIDLIFAELPPPPVSTFLGPLASADAAFTLDTLGSAFDTELGLWDASGLLVLSNDDAQGGLQSELDLFAGLAVGTYYVGLGGWDTTYGDGFAVNSAGNAEFGVYNFNFPGGTLSDNLSQSEIAFFSFDVVPEPSTPMLLGLAFAGLFLKRRRR